MADYGNIPVDFLDRMKSLLKNEYEDFAASYEKERYQALRINPLKAGKECILGSFSTLTGVPWEENGFYYDGSLRPGKHPLHEAGAYYIQEPSAMSAVAVLDPKEGDVVLDLCASPGGKTTQIAGRLNNTGLLVSNEIIKDRAKILSQNIERLGVRNAVVLNESPEKLASCFHGFFDKILVDAPCSGEGMFRKEDSASTEWSLENVALCAERQKNILESAATMLKAGGNLCYSTCTFSVEENEGVISEFLDAHPEFSICESPLEDAGFFSKARPEWLNEKNNDLSHAFRLWPHKLKGEGHFVCLLKKAGSKTGRPGVSDSGSKKKIGKEESVLRDFLLNELKIKKETVDALFNERSIVSFGENLYLTPSALANLKSLKTERPGLHVAIDKKNRLEPAHALAMSLRPEETDSFVDLSDSDAIKYLKGETINVSPSLKGYVLVTYKNVSMGFGKAVNGILKNHYPKGLRRETEIN